MSLVRWEPFSEIASLRQVMDRMLDDSFFRPAMALYSPELPAVDMFDADESIVVKATLPGLKPEDVDITITGDTLTIKGDLKLQDNEIKRENYYRKERRTGSFSRTIALPLPVQIDKAQAVYEHGILTLTLPKAESLKPKTIKIQTGDGGKTN